MSAADLVLLRIRTLQAEHDALKRRASRVVPLMEALRESQRVVHDSLCESYPNAPCAKVCQQACAELLAAKKAAS